MKVKSIDKEINYLKELNSIKNYKINSLNKSRFISFKKFINLSLRVILYFSPLICIVFLKEIIPLIISIILILGSCIYDFIDRRFNKKENLVFYKKDIIEINHDYTDDLDYSKSNRFDGKLNSKGTFKYSSDYIDFIHENSFTNYDLELSYEETLNRINNVIEMYKDIYNVKVNVNSNDFNNLADYIYDVLCKNNREKEFYSYFYHLIRITISECIALDKEVTITDLHHNLEFNVGTVRNNNYKVKRV